MDDSLIYIYAYLHGFCSNISSAKGNFMKEAFLGGKQEVLHLINLNTDPNNDASTSIKKGFQELDALYKREQSINPEKHFKFRLIGSSLGGYTSALYATDNPDKVDSIFLMCPAFNLRDKVETLISMISPSAPADIQKILALWKNMGHLPFRQTDSPQILYIPYSFIEELESVQKYPKYKCPAIILTGTLDTLITLDDINDFLKLNEEQARLTKLITVHDDHYLMNLDTLAKIKEVSAEFFK